MELTGEVRRQSLLSILPTGTGDSGCTVLYRVDRPDR
jgi:hypothetical protein